jgi:diadenosine tetraphosphate (Ap4A) HIT family hydrolase
MSCPFCFTNDSRIILYNNHAVAIYDGFPVSPGHSLLIPKRHIASFFEATREKLLALTELLKEMQKVIQTELNPNGFNIGVNIGAAAGQTIMHLHVHLIPRYAGDRTPANSLWSQHHSANRT